MARQEEKSGQIFDLIIIKRLFSFTNPYKGKFWFLVLIIILLACVIPLNPLLIRHAIDTEIANKVAARRVVLEKGYESAAREVRKWHPLKRIHE